jgi:hypothetical protein
MNEEGMDVTDFEKDCQGLAQGIADELDKMDEEAFYDYVTDVLDIEYRSSNEKEYRSVRLMITCGGPNIYLDTSIRSVELFWSGTTLHVDLSEEVCDRIDSIYSELWDSGD